MAQVVHRYIHTRTKNTKIYKKEKNMPNKYIQPQQYNPTHAN